MSNHGDMSMVPYHGNHGGIMVRKGSTVVVYDHKTKQMIAGKSDFCPTCNGPINKDTRRSSISEDFSDQARHDYIGPDYFRLLQASREPSRGHSPHKILLPPRGTEDGAPDNDSYASTSEESVLYGRHIPGEAFSTGFLDANFEVERELGRGGRGVVLLVSHSLRGFATDNNRFQLAVKRIPVGDDQIWLRKVLREVSLMTRLHHENIVAYNHAWLEYHQVSDFAPSVPCMFILQQYCNSGDLHNYMFGPTTAMSKDRMKENARRRRQSEPIEPPSNPRFLSLDQIFSFFEDITRGLQYLHKESCIHRDLKPSNVLLHNDGRGLLALIGDFGEVQTEDAIRESTGNTGTISFCAPEVLTRQYPGGPYVSFSKKSDIFSLGLLLHLMCFAKLPYKASNVIDEDEEDMDILRDEILAWKGIDLKKDRVRDDLPEKFYQYLEILLSPQPDMRPTTEDILHRLDAGIFPFLQGRGDRHEGEPFQQPTFPSRAGRTRSTDTPNSPVEGVPRARGLSIPEAPIYRAPYVDDDFSASPTKERKTFFEASEPPESNLLVRHRLVRQPAELTKQRTNLLLPEPTGFAYRIRVLTQKQEVQAVGKLLLFFLQIWSLLDPCKPQATKTIIAWPLFIAATLNLIGVFRGAATTVSLSLIHFFTIVLARTMGSLCEVSLPELVSFELQRDRND